tara:strand:+ start:1044 stop:1442 length:399 start_codon:yes stop_codon:yes gene_type:complete
MELVKIAIPQSISFDEDLLFELKHKAKQEGKGLSTLINEKSTFVSDGTFVCVSPCFGSVGSNKKIKNHNNLVIIKNNNKDQSGDRCKPHFLYNYLSPLEYRSGTTSLTPFILYTGHTHKVFSNSAHEIEVQR